MFVFPEELTIVQVDQCKSELLALIDKSESISFDDSKLIKVDTVGIQLLLAVVTYISSQNKALKWHSTSPILKQSVEKLGVNEAILTQYLTSNTISV